jgi:dihydrofolate reductase
MSRPLCSVFIATSLDGYVARQNGSIDWLDIVQRQGEDYGYARFWGSIDAVVVGRGTYQTALGFPTWPYTGKRCVVLTHAAFERRHDEEFHAGDPQPLLERLGAEGVRRVYVDGGRVITALLATGVVDQLTISVLPILLGEGRRLFGPSDHEQLLSLVRTQAFPSGLVQLEYQVGSR